MSWQLAADTAVGVGETSRRLYFFEERLPDGARNVRHVYAPVDKHGVVLEGSPETSFLNARSFCGSIVRVAPRHYRLYYTLSGPRGMRLAVAESADLQRWILPKLRQDERPEFPANVLVVDGAPGGKGDTERVRGDRVGQPQVVRTDDGRWRMFYWHHQHGWARLPYLYTIAESSDGLVWTAADYHRPALNSHFLGDQSCLSESGRLAEKARRTNDANFVYRNPWLGCYEQFSQWFLDAHPDRRVQEDNCPQFNRMIQRRLSADGRTFSPPQLVLQTDERDPWDLQFYYLSVQYHEDWYVGSLGHYRVENEQQTMDLELAFSRDGRVWHRPLRGGFIPREHSGPDSEGVYPTNAWLADGDRWLCLYTGTNRKHNAPADSDSAGSWTMLASWPRDRLVGIAAGRVPGGFLTPIFFPEGDQIRVDAAVRGWLRAELCDAWGRKLDGYHLQDAISVSGDAGDHALRWRTADPRRFRHDPVRIRFELVDAVVYSVRF